MSLRWAVAGKHTIFYISLKLLEERLAYGFPAEVQSS